MNQLALTDEPQAVAVPERPPANDLRHAMMSLPVERQNQFLALYKESRDNFRGWLMSQLIEGVHYGIVPGCEPKEKDINGVKHFGVWNKKADNGKGKMEWYPHTQWTPKPSLYAAGADFICDVCGVRDEYETDAVGWQQMGGKAGTAVVKCRLKSRATDELIGESLGAHYSQWDANNALKMASKCAKVGAVINAYDLRDLFTQDDPNDKPPPNDNPGENEAAPKAEPRAKRQQAVTKEQCVELLAAWKKLPGNQSDPSGDVAKWHGRFFDWVRASAGRDFDPSKATNWTAEDYRRVDVALAALEGK